MEEKTTEKRHEINSSRNKKVRDRWKPILLVIVVISIFIVANLLGLGEKLGDMQNWIQSLGPWGPVAFIIIYIGSVIAAIPGTILTFVAGALFGTILGIIIISFASTVGACITFLIARYFARDAVERWLSKSTKFQRLDKLTEKHGAIIVAITRLIPIFPFNLLNYGFGLTSVSFKTYAFWSWLCMLPATIVFVAGADAILQAFSSGEIPWFLIGIIIIFSCILGIAIRYAKRRLDTKENEAK